MLAILALATLSVAQSHKPVNFSTSIGSNGAYDLLNFDLCNSTFDKANATGIYSFDPGVIQGTYNSSAYGVNSRTLPEAAWVGTSPQRSDSNIPGPHDSRRAEQERCELWSAMGTVLQHWWCQL